MAAPTPLYTKLPGRGRRGSAAFSYARSRLWLGEDHLLNVDFTVASEEYRRFYFRDIEALVIRRTAKRQVWNWIFLALLLLSAGPFFVAWRSEGSIGFLIAAGSLAAFWGLFLLVNTLRGATCQTHIRTAVQTEQLPSLGRLPVARKVLEKLKPLIVATQGASTPEELVEAPWMTAEAKPEVRFAAGAKPVRADKGKLHGALFGLLIFEAIVMAAYYFAYHEPLSVWSMLALLAGSIVCIVALKRQGETDLPDSVRAMTKVALGFYILKCGIGFVYIMIYAIRNPGRQLVTGLEVAGEPGFVECALGTAALGVVIGLIGLIVLVAHLLRARPVPVA